MSDFKIDTGGGNVLDCVDVVDAVVIRCGDEIDAVCWLRLREELKELQAERNATKGGNNA